MRTSLINQSAAGCFVATPSRVPPPIVQGAELDCTECQDLECQRWVLPTQILNCIINFAGQGPQ
jgi:hypothetical protein